MTDGSRLVIAGDSTWTQQALAKWPHARVVATVRDLSLLEYMVSNLDVDFCLVDPGLSPKGESFNQWLKRFKTAFPKITVVVGDHLNPGKSGLSDAAETGPSVEPKILTSQTIVVWSPKGGVGKTFFATNLACATSLITRGNVLLMDLDLYSGDVAVYLDLMEGPTVTDLIPVLSEIRPDGLDKYIQRYGPADLNVILSPRRPELSDLVTSQHIGTLLSIADKRFGLVYIDTPPDITSDVVGQCIEAASRIVMIVTQDPATLQQSRVALEILWKLGIGKDMITVILNRASRDSLMPQSKVEDFLGVQVAGVIPEDRKLAERAAFEGKPAVMYPKSELAQSLWESVSAVCPGLVVPRNKKNARERKGLFW